MALSTCVPVSTDPNGREQIKHGTALFPVACYHDDLHQFGVEWHWHEELEVFTVETGTARVSVPGADYIIKQGEGFFVNTGILHGVWQDGAESCHLHSIVFHPHYIGGSADSILWQKYLEPLLTSSSCSCVHFTGVQKEPVGAIDRAWQLCAREEEGYEFGIRDQLSQVVLFLAQNLAFATKKPSAKTLRDGERMKRMLQYIQEHYAEEIFLPQIAESAHIGESECLRCFRSMIGCSPLQYVKQLRLQKAAGLLLSTNLKISEIGMQCGFQEMSYFAKEFRAMKGCTPRDFRNRR